MLYKQDFTSIEHFKKNSQTIYTGIILNVLRTIKED